MKSMEQVFKTGLARVSKIPDWLTCQDNQISLDSIFSYQPELTEIIDKKWVTPEVALEIYGNELQWRKIQAISLVPEVINAFGKTENNIKEFEFLSRFLLKFHVNIPIENIAYPVNKKSEKKFSLTLDEQRWAIELFKHWVFQHQKISLLTLSHILIFTKAFFSFLAGSKQVRWRTIPFIVVANDHSPQPIAFSMVSEWLGIPRIYVQHAEVTTHFPPLNFEISILRNDHSLDQYKAIAPIAGKVFIVSRLEGGVQKDAFANVPIDPVKVCLYLTANAHIEKIGKIIFSLKKNPAVSSVLLKPHPRMKASDINYLKKLKVEVIDQIYPNEHIAICQNSSIVMELLHIGIRTYQIFGYDGCGKDYYGFVGLGITKQIDIADLNSRFWLDFKVDDAWLNAFSRLNPSVKTNKLDLTSLFTDLKKYLYKASLLKKVGESQVVTINEMSLKYPFFARSPYAYKFAIYQLSLNANLALKLVDSFQVESNSINNDLRQEVLIELIENLHKCRAPEFVRILTNTSRCAPHSLFAAWLKLKAVEWIYAGITDSEMNQILILLTEKRSPTNISAKINELLVKNLIALKSYFWLNHICKKESVLFSSLPLNLKIELLKLPRSSKYPDLLTALKKCSHNLNRFEKFKLTLLGRPQKDVSAFTHSDAVKKLREFAPKNLIDELDKFVFSKYEAVQHSMSYMDVQWDIDQKSKLLLLLRKKISDKSPFAFIRLSDGEGYLFQENALFFDSNAVANRELHWWGEVLEDHVRRDVVKLNRDAIEEADILGIPSVYRIVRDLNQRMTHLTEMGGGVTGKGLLEVLRYVSSKPKNILLTEEKANFALFDDIEVLRDLCGLADRVIFVTSVRKEILQNLLGAHSQIHVINLPSHFRTRSNPNYVEDSCNFPFVLSESMAELESTVRVGDLVFVSAGVVGKVLIAQAKRLGGVGVDLGHVIDFFVHRHTVDIQCGLDEDNNKNKGEKKTVADASFWSCVDRMQLTYFLPQKASNVNNEHIDQTREVSAHFFHLFRMRNYRSASKIICNKKLIGLTDKQLFQLVRCGLYANLKMESAQIVSDLMQEVASGKLQLAWIPELIALINLCDFSYSEKHNQFKTLECMLSVVQSNEKQKKDQARKIKHAQFLLDIENCIDADPFDYMDTDFSDPASLKAKAAYFGALQIRGCFGMIEKTLMQLFDCLGFSDADTLRFFLQFLPEWTLNKSDFDSIPVSAKYNLKTLPVLSNLKGFSKKFNEVYFESIQFNKLRYANSDDYVRDALLRAFLKAEAIADARELICCYGFKSDMLSAYVVKGFDYFDKDNFIMAKSSFLKVLKEDPTDSLAKNGLRFCFPRTGSSIKMMLDLRDEVGYVGSGPKIEVQKASEKIYAELFSGNYLSGLYEKRKSLHWRILSDYYGSKFLCYRSLPNCKGAGKSLFLISDEGVGDEVRTIQFYESLLKSFDKIIVTCDPRLFDMLSGSYLSIHFVPVQRLRSGVRKLSPGDAQRFVTSSVHISNYLTEDCREFLDAADYITFGQNLFFNYFAGRIEKPQPGAYLKNLGREVRVNKKNKLIRVGLLWRSAFKTTLRKYMYLDLKELIPLTVLEGVEFWSFQHCIDDDEVKICQDNGIRLITDIDLYNDFNGMADYLVEMDYLIGVSSLPIELAAALGVKVWMLGFSPENYFLRTAGGKTDVDQLTLNSRIIAPKWIDFSAPRSECVQIVVDEAKQLLEAEVRAFQQKAENIETVVQ